MSNPRRGRGGRFVKSGAKHHHKKKRRHKAKRRHHSKAAVVTVRTNTRRRRRVHRNPRGLAVGHFFAPKNIIGDLTAGAIGAAGALGVDALLTYLAAPRADGTTWLPATLATGLPRTGVRLAAALGVGFLWGRFVNRRQGMALTVGALTVIGYDVGRSALNQYVMPSNMQLSEGDYTDLTMASLGGSASAGGSTAGSAAMSPAMSGYLRRQAVAGYIARGGVAGAPALHPNLSAFVNARPTATSTMEGLNADLEM